MVDRDLVYIFADPFGRQDSGVSSYSAFATGLLRKNRIDTTIVARNPRETIWTYRHRLASTVISAGKDDKRVIVEAPESDAATSAIPVDKAEVHIRLHCSRQLGAFVQGDTVNHKSLAMEQGEIQRASYISAPSQSAVVASRLIFDLPNDICCYPNPAPMWEADRKVYDAKEHKYVVFVGRFQSLKGAHWLVDLVKALPEVPFLLVTPTSDANVTKSKLANLTVIDGKAWSKREIYGKAKLVIIPSLYETASMVGIEALAAGIPVISWAHLGIVEYASQPMITRVEPYRTDLFAEAVRFKARSSRNTSDLSLQNSKINDLYLKGFKATLNGSCENFMPVAITTKEMKDCFSKISWPMDMRVMNSLNQNSPWRRKLRKFRRDPVRFFTDTWAAKVILPPGKNLPPKKESQSFSEGSKGKMLPGYFATIGEVGKIEFKTPPEKPKGNIAAFLYPEGRKEEAQSILEGLGKFDDFKYTRSPLLQLGTFKELGSWSAVELIERIDRQNKRKISSIDHIILYNPPPALVEGLRSCGTGQRTICIFDAKENTLPDPWHTDVIILVGSDHSGARLQTWRHKIVVSDRAHLPLAIRRAIQEGTLKNPDLLLPILGFEGNHRSELLNINAQSYQGIIRAKPGMRPTNGTMADICTELANSTTEIAVAESVFLRYRSLCERIDNTESRAQFFAYSLSDGVMFDVRR